MKKYKTICNRCGKDIVGVAGINWNEGFKQGYAKALADVEKVIDKINKKYRSCLAVTDMDDFDCDIVIGFNKELKQSLAKLEKKC